MHFVSSKTIVKYQRNIDDALKGIGQGIDRELTFPSTKILQHDHPLSALFTFNVVQKLTVSTHVKKEDLIFCRGAVGEAR